ncbi:MAG: hypothetical protein IJ746_02610 [Ruminococcus sp.]|nr:hypothetical protein [Ruminococcus sp.]
MIKKILSILAGAVLAVSAFAMSASAEDIEVKSSTSKSTSEGVSYVIPQAKFSPVQISNSTSITINYEGGEGAAESPVKLVLTYWNSDSDANGGAGEPATCEVIPATFGDGVATAEHTELIKALGSVDFSPVYEIAVYANGGGEIKCSSVVIKDAVSREEVADSTTPVSIDASSAKESTNWGQSLTAEYTVFDASRMTTSSKVIVNFETDAEDLETSPLELILQSWEDPDTPMNDGGKVWAKVAPAELGEGYAVFNYVDMIEAYGTADFTKLSAINVGDTGTAMIKCTGMYITNCKPDGNHYVAEEESDSSEEEAESVEGSKAETTTTKAAAAPAEETTTASTADSGSSSSGSNIIFIVIGVVAGIVLAVAALFIILGRKSKESYDVESHQFVKKK